MVRFLLLAKWDRHRGLTDGLTIESYLTAKNYSDAFIHDVLLPSFAAIGTCSYKAIRQYPAETVIDFLASGMLFNGIWRAKSGADDAIQRMLEHCHQQHCDTAISSIKKRPAANGVMAVTVADQHGKEHQFDHVVLAIQANQIAALLGDDEADAISCLQTIGYERSEVVVHSDVSLAPGHHKKGPPVLFEVDPHHDSPMASICLNKLYPSLQNAPALFQTWNPLREPAVDTVIGRAFFERPLVTPASLDSIRRLSELQRQPDRVIWYSGSYAKPGVPLLESALQSSMDIAQRLGADIPWTV
jgi:predicted NAD/FAD-binding protein